MLAATWFDGRSASAHAAQLLIAGGALRVLSATDGTVLREARLDEVEVSEPLAHAPRLLHFRDGACLEVPESATLARALGAAGRPDGTVARLQQQWPASLAALVLLLATLALGYTHGLPAAARWAAAEMSPELVDSLGTEVLAAMDAGFLEPSRLPAAQQRAIRGRLAAAAARADDAPPFRVEFRRTERGGVVGGFNAFALPGGRLVLLDGLVENTSDEQLLGVVAHELGHLAERHPLRSLLQSLGLAAAAALVWGDVSGLVANAPVVLGALGYSRDFERAADAYAVRFMAANGLGAGPLVEVLEKLQRAPGGEHGGPAMLRTHPGLEERIGHLRALSAGAPP